MDLSPWLQVGGLGLGGVAVVLLLMGKLLPSTWVDRRMADKDKVIARLESANDKNSATLDQLSQNDRELLEMGRATTHALESIQGAVEKHRES